ncbi:MAG: Gfo/Idh/MocA family oxidoreductase [Gemmatimonadetes bacterium]|nr:Gfo/Idh/MocA family oxidoreductase [Gemmatimonadota bacterium]
MPRSPYYEKELEVRFSRSYGPGRYDPRYEEGGQDYPLGYVRWTEQRNLEAFLDLLASGGVRVAPLITHRYGIAEATRAYDLLTGRREPCLGIVLDYPDPPVRQTRLAARATTAGHGGLGVGLIGPGSFARSTLLPAVQAVPGVRLRGVAAATGLTVASVTERHGFAFGTTEADEVLADADTHAVIIATRHHLHAGQVIAALRAGKHVYVEKPLCIREDELRPILAAAAAAPDRLLMVGFNRRFAPLVGRLTGLVGRRTGPMQLHYRINAGRVPAQSWVHDPAVGGGRIIGECCHFLDLAGALVGQPAERISAVASTADSIAVLAGYPDGSVATVEYFSFGHPGVSKERLEVVCDGGIYRLDDFRSLTWDTGAGRGTESAGTQDKGHRGSIAAFLESVRTGGPAPVPLADQVASMQATFRAIEAAAAGTGLVVSRPLEGSVGGA